MLADKWVCPVPSEKLAAEPADPRSLDNLWMQPLTEARVKDADENRMHRAICDGRVTLRAAQAAILLRWGPHVRP
jgi:hypothetical protein